MADILFVLALVAIAGVLIVLVIGLIAFLRGERIDPGVRNRLMRWRVALQMLAIVLLAAAFIVREFM